MLCQSRVIICSQSLPDSLGPDPSTTVSSSVSAVRGNCTMTVGNQCKITMNKKEYNSKVAAKGTSVIYIFHILKSFTGTRAEMDSLKDKFVTGEWIPPFIVPSPAPRRKSKKETMQPSPAPKRKNRR